MKKNRAKAFTLLELLIVLVLSGILISTISFTYLKIQQSFVRMQRSNSEVKEFSRFYNIFYRDFYDAQAVSYSNYYKTLYITVNGTETEYSLLSHKIERKQGDDEKTWSFQVARWDMEYLEDTELVKWISCDIFNDDKEGYKIYWTKHYSYKVLFENEFEED